MSAKAIADYLRSKSYAELERAYDGLAKQYAAGFVSKEAINESKLNGVFRIGDPSQHQNNHAVPKLFNDGVVLSKSSFHRSVADNTINAVPVMFGTTRDESKGFQVFDTAFITVEEGKRKIIDTERYQLVGDYVSALWKASGADEPAASFVSAGHPAFVFRFDWDALPTDIEGKNIKALYGASHAIDFRFIFGGEKSLFSEHKLSAADRSLSSAVMSYWAAFAYTGRPGKGRNDDLPEWRSWSNASDSQDKTLLLNIPSAGGVRLSAIHGNRQQVLDQIAVDPRVSDISKRCQLYRDILEHSLTFITLAEFEALEDGLCVGGRR